MSISTLSAWMTGQPCSAEENASQTVTSSEPPILTPWGTLQLIFPPKNSTVVMMIAAESLGAARAAEPVSLLTVSTGVRPDCG